MPSDHPIGRLGHPHDQPPPPPHPKASSYAPAARMPLHLPNTISTLAKAAARPEWLSIQCIDVLLHSHSLSHAVDEASYSLLLDSSPDVHSRALALSSTISHAGDWLNVVPSTALGLHLLDCEFRLCLRYWLGI